MSLVNELIKGLLPEEEKKKVVLVYGGGFNFRHKLEIAAEGGSDFHESTEAKELANA